MARVRTLAEDGGFRVLSVSYGWGPIDYEVRDPEGNHRGSYPKPKQAKERMAELASLRRYFVLSKKRREAALAAAEEVI